MDQAEYDNWSEHLLKAVRMLMGIGSDNPQLTAEDIKDQVNDTIAEEFDGTN